MIIIGSAWTAIQAGPSIAVLLKTATEEMDANACAPAIR